MQLNNRAFFKALLFVFLSFLVGALVVPSYAEQLSAPTTQVTEHPLTPAQIKAKMYDATIIPAYDMKTYDDEIVKLYKTISNSPIQDFGQRIAAISQFFLNRPYILGALGEGPAGDFDQNPIYRTDGFDCVTYVDTVLALAEAKNLEEFKNTIRQIRYSNGIELFRFRNHFTDVDWNYNNSSKGFIRDITYKISDKDGTPASEIANTVINKKGWYNAFDLSHIRVLDKQGPQNIDELLKKLRTQADKTPKERSVVLYIPLTKLFDQNGKPNYFIFSQIPNGAILEMVRPDWDLTQTIGTHVNISHLGFAIRNEQGLFFREASSLEKEVLDIPLTEYLKKYLSSATLKGIHVEVAVWQNSQAQWKKLQEQFSESLSSN